MMGNRLIEFRENPGGRLGELGELRGKPFTCLYASPFGVVTVASEAGELLR
jgi:hypothetical protein